MCSCSGPRGVLWSVWWVVNLIGIICFALGFVNFNNLLAVYFKAKQDTAEILTILIAIFFTNILSLLQVLLTFLLMVCKSAVRSRAGFTYGFLASSTAYMSLILTFTAFLLMGFKSTVKDVFETDVNTWNLDWKGGDTMVFSINAYINFIGAAGYLVFFGTMVFMSRSIGRKEKVDEKVDIEAE